MAYQDLREFVRALEKNNELKRIKVEVDPILEITEFADRAVKQGGPALRDLAGVLRNFGDPRDVTSLLRRTTFNMAVGNADAHAKNFSLLHERDSPTVTLAPLYDVISTISLEITDNTGQPMQADTHLGQRVGGETSIRKVTAGNLIDEAATWGIRRRAAAAVVTEMLEQVLTAIPETRGDERVLAAIREQAIRIRDR